MKSEVGQLVSPGVGTGSLQGLRPEPPLYSEERGMKEKKIKGHVSKEDKHLRGQETKETGKQM